MPITENVNARNEAVIDMQTLEAKFSPDDGGPSRTITLRLGDPAPSTEMGCWGVLVEVLGFDEPFAQTIYGTDWAQAIELAAKIMPIMLENYVADAEGTLEPSFYERPPYTPDLSGLPPDIFAKIDASNTSDTSDD